MAEYCSQDCKETGAICDFCIHYNFNGDEEGSYTGDGYCKLLDIYTDPHDGFDCEHFHCFRIKQSKCKNYQEESGNESFQKSLDFISVCHNNFNSFDCIS